VSGHLLTKNVHTLRYTDGTIPTLGLVLSGQVTDELGAQNIAQMMGGINIFLCGKLFT